MEEKPIIYNTPLGDMIILSKKFLQENYINLTWKKFENMSSEENDFLEKKYGLRKNIPDKIDFKRENWDMDENLNVTIPNEFIESQLQSEHHHIIWEMLKEGYFD